MSKKSHVDSTRSIIPQLIVNPTECPFREFRDNELSTDYWGLGPAACRAAVLMPGKAIKPPADFVWVDDQTQPLPRSVRQYLHGWIRAEELAMSRWEADVVIYEEGNGGATSMSVMDTQLSHAQVLMRSMFCRKALSACFVLERVDGLTVEHQWDNFVFSFGPEGWRAKYHIYSPGIKAGGGPQHRPGLSKNGCYLVRLYYLGAWRCVWVSDQIPVDATDAPLLPFSPLICRTPSKPGTKVAPAAVTANVVYLWPLLICKALLKLAAPDMSSDEDVECAEDEPMLEFDMFHALTGCMKLSYQIKDPELLWKLVIAEIPLFGWDDDDETLPSTVKSKNTKKATTKETVYTRNSVCTILVEDTKSEQPFVMPGITPNHEMSMLVTVARDLPLKKPLPEPDIAPWKQYRWIHWARRHGLYEAFDCPRTRFLKANGLMKLSYTPHLLDVLSTESITFGFRQEHEKSGHQPTKKGAKGDANRSQTAVTTKTGNVNVIEHLKEELREWVQFDQLQKFMKETNILYLPSMFEYTTATSNAPQRIKAPNRALDIQAQRGAPLYLQIDGPHENNLKLSLSMLHPRVLMNSGIPILDQIEPAYLLLEKFDWFEDCEVPVGKAFVQTRGYDSVEVKFQPGRHYCRLWVHSQMHWHVMLLSESTLLLGTRDVIQSVSVRECPWAAKFLSNLSTSFANWIRVNRSNMAFEIMDRDFYRSYKPDLCWDLCKVGYSECQLHWMFRQAVQSVLSKKLSPLEFQSVCKVLRYYFCDPDFGLPSKPKPPKTILRDVVALDPCDCFTVEPEETEYTAECLEEQIPIQVPLVDSSLMDKLLREPTAPIVSQVCELATTELPCGVLKDEREKTLKRHEAATLIQANWRGCWARKCVYQKVNVTSDVLKLIMENSFGNLEALSALMNQFFEMFPGAKTAYSVASALSGSIGLMQHHGSSTVTPKCKWIPYFQGIFYCHAPVKVHFDLYSTLQHSTVMVYNNDTGKQMPQVYNAHITFDFIPNNNGYTVIGHGSLNQRAGTNSEAHWQLTVQSSVNGVFHVCDNDIDGCKECPLEGSYKTHIDEMFIPNRRNILGGILLSITKYEGISFRAATTSPDLEIVATLRTTSPQGETQELGQCSGKGEIFWPNIQLKPISASEVITTRKRSTSHANLVIAGVGAGQKVRKVFPRSAPSLQRPPQAHNLRGSCALPLNHDGDPMNVKVDETLTEISGGVSARSLPKAQTRSHKYASNVKNKSVTKIKIVEPKQYSIEVTAPNGWPLTLAQWIRVDEAINTTESVKIETPKKPSKPASAKDKDRVPSPPALYMPHEVDAFTEMECCLSVGGGSTARRDDRRDLEFVAARRSWEAKDPGRNLRGAAIRNEFRVEFLESLSGPPSDTVPTIIEETIGEEIEGEDINDRMPLPQGPTPVSESGMMEMAEESEEELMFLSMPDQLKDKFIPLYFLPFCLKEKTDDEHVLVSNDMAEAAKQDRLARIEAGLDRMRELQEYNLEHVIKRQRRRCQLLETLFVDSHWKPNLVDALNKRDDAIAVETLNRTVSANKKKLDMKTGRK